MNRIKIKKPRGSDYPPDDGAPRWHWNWNHVCIPCREAKRGSQGSYPKCPKCSFPMMLMRHGRPPKRQDSWWKSENALEKWNIHKQLVAIDVARRASLEADDE